MASTRAAHGRMLEDYLALLRRRWFVLVASVLVGVMLAALYATFAPQTYVSSSKVLVRQTGTDPVADGARTNDAINLDTEAQLVRSAPVAEIAADNLDTTLTTVALASRVTVTVPPNTTVLEIAYAGDSPQAAQAGADAFAEAYLENRAAQVDAALTEQRETVTGQVDQTTTSLAEITSQLRDEGVSDDERDVLVSQRATLDSRLASLSEQLGALSASPTSPGQIINVAQLPRTARDPNPLLVLPSGLFLGLLAGLGLALWRERSDRRLHEVADIDRLYGLTPLAELRPTVGMGSAGATHTFDVRALYHSLRANGPDATEVVLVVAPDASRTAETVAMNLGVTASRSGADTVYLADGDVTRKTRRQRSGGSLTTLRYADAEYLVVDGEINAAQLQHHIHETRQRHDFVLLGLPTGDPTVGLPMLARHVDVVVLLVELGRSTRASVAETLRSLRTSGANAVFVVSVDPRRGRGRRRGQQLVADDQGDDAEPPDARGTRRARPDGEDLRSDSSSSRAASGARTR